MSSHSVSGLCWLNGGALLYQQVPLQNVHVDATLYDMCAEVKVQQTYVNNVQDTQYGFSHAALECVYIFPLDEDSVVFSFVAELDGVVVEGRVREKMEARAEYNSAIARNFSAMLLEQSLDNIFQCKIGNLKFGSVCTITLTYMTLLEQQGRHNRLTLPMIIAPKYTPPKAGPTPAFALSSEPAPHNTVHKGYYCTQCLCSPIIGTRHHCDTCVYDICHGCYVQHDPSHHMHTITGDNPSLSDPLTVPTPSSHTTIQSKLRDLTIKLTITVPSPILSIQCPSHPSETKITQNPHSMYHATAFFHSVSMCSLSKDFILLVEQQRCFEPRVLCELDAANHTAAVSLAFIPPPLDMLSASQMHSELIFLIDCSGSMHGSSITCVRECMQLLLRSLPVHSRFNILFFGNTWSSLFPSSQAYDDASLSAASQCISKLQANLGGTEIYPPLFHVLTNDILPTHPRQVFLLTDGQVSNVQQLVQLTSQHAVSTRLFTFGIGDSVDRLLCKKLAHAGRGKCEFVTADDGGGSAMREKVVRQVARAMQPVFTDVKVDWRQLKGPAGDGMSAEVSTTSPVSFLQCPSVAPAIFMSSRYILHALNVSLPDIVWQQATEGCEVDFKCEITITVRSNHPHETEHMNHSVMLTGEQITQARVIHTLAAKERIRELEDEVLSCSGEARKKLEDEILQLAMKHTLSSSRTSFVVVYNPDTDEERVEEMAPLCRRDVLSVWSSRSCASSPLGSFKATAFSTLKSSKPRMKGVQAQSTTSPIMFGSAQPQFSSASEWLSSTQLHHSYLPRRQLRCAMDEESEHTGGLCGSQTDSSASFGAASSRAFLFGSVQQGPNLGGSFVPPPQQTAAFANSFSTASPVQHTAAFANSFGTKSVQAVGNGIRSAGFSSQKDAKSTAFEDLIQLQLAAGMWLITPELIDIVHTTLPMSSSTITIQSLQAMSKEHGVEDAVVGVILALQLLETHYKDRHAEWEMLATKSLFFLSENSKSGGADAQQEIKDTIAKLLLM